MRLENDPRCQSGAYLAYQAHLYETVALKAQQQSSNMGIREVLLLKVVDCASPEDEPEYRWLTEQQIRSTTLVRGAPAVEDAAPA